MTRRGALAAVSVAAAMIAVWAAASGASGSHVETNRGVESVITSIFLPVVLFGVVAMLGALVSMLLRRRGEGEEADVEAEVSRLAQVIAVILALGLFCLIAYLIYSTRAHHVAHSGYEGLPIQGGRQAPLTKAVPINHPAFDTTSIVLALLAIGYLAHRFGWLRRPGRPLADLGSAHEPSFVGTHGGRRTQGELAEPADPSTEPDPRRAIVLAYQRFLWVMSRHGVARAEQETPFEYCARVGSKPPATGPAGAATRRLTTLFSAARYGTDPLSARDRSAAIDSLGVISGEIDEER